MKRLITSVIASTALVIGGLFAAPVVLSGLNLTQVASAQASQNSNVTIQNFAFSPATLNITQGTTVTWTNKDNTAHTVTSDSGNTLNSGNINPNNTFNHTFDQPGTYTYHCSIHPNMKGTIVVASSSSSQQNNQQQNTQQPSGTSSGNSNQSSGSTMQMGGRGGGTGGTSNGTSNGTSATGPAATGSGSTAGLRHIPEIVGGAIALIAAGVILIIRRLITAGR